MERSLIAPCGINCAVCRQYQKKKDGCKGCRFETNLKSRTCNSEKTAPNRLRPIRSFAPAVRRCPAAACGILTAVTGKDLWLSQRD